MEAEYRATGDEALGKQLDQKWGGTLERWAVEDMEKKRPQFNALRETASAAVDARLNRFDMLEFLRQLGELVQNEAIAAEMARTMPGDLRQAVDLYNRYAPDRPIFRESWHYMSQMTRVLDRARKALGITVYEYNTPHRSAADENRNEG
jgi:hypothetical protein